MLRKLTYQYLSYIFGRSTFHDMHANSIQGSKGVTIETEHG